MRTHFTRRPTQRQMRIRARNRVLYAVAILAALALVLCGAALVADCGAPRGAHLLLIESHAALWGFVVSAFLAGGSILCVEREA